MTKADYERGKRDGYGSVKCKRCGWHAHCECISNLEATIKELTKDNKVVVHPTMKQVNDYETTKFELAKIRDFAMDLQKENKELKLIVDESHKNKCLFCDNRQDEGDFAPICSPCWKTKPYFSGIVKLKEQNSKLADELENIKEIIVPDENTILRDADILTKYVYELNKIIKRLRGEKD